MKRTATPVLIALALTALLAGAAVAAGSATGHGDTDAAKKKSSQRSKWKRERGLVFKMGLENPDIVALGGNRFRAYLMTAEGIKSALSTNGRKFTLEDGLRVAGAAHHAVVKLADGRYRMYFSRQEGPNSQVRAHGDVLSAVSGDGLNFTVEPGVRLQPGGPGSLDSNAIIHPHVIPLPEEGFRMFYDAEGPLSKDGGPNWRGIMSANSPDGLTWAKDPGVRIRPKRAPIKFAHLVWSPFAEYKNNRYNLYFSVETDEKPAKRAGIYVATSRNGRKFAIRRKPVLGLNPRVGKKPESGPGGMAGLPQDAFIIKVKGGKRLFFWEARKGTYSASQHSRK